MRKMMGLEFQVFFDLVYIYSIEIVKIISKNFLIYNESDTLKQFNAKQKIYFNLTG